MGKIKSALVILLTAALLVGGSMLPAVAARIQDHTTTNVVQYENIEALQLRLEEEALSMTYPEKMFLMMHGEALDIEGKDTKIKEQNILEATYTAIAPYMELFLGASVDNDYVEYDPIMVYDGVDPSHYVNYWHVTMSLDMSLHDSLSVILDDETGKLLAIELIDPEMYIEPGYLQELQIALAENYFKELELVPIEEWPVAVESVDKAEAMGMLLAATEYVLADPVYGEIYVQVGVRTDGFYIYIV